MEVHLIHITDVVHVKPLAKKYSISPLIRINWDSEPSVYAENADKRIFFFK